MLYVVCVWDEQYSLSMRQQINRGKVSFLFSCNDTGTGQAQTFKLKGRKVYRLAIKNIHRYFYSNNNILIHMLTSSYTYTDTYTRGRTRRGTYADI